MSRVGTARLLSCSRPRGRPLCRPYEVQSFLISNFYEAVGTLQAWKQQQRMLPPMHRLTPLDIDGYRLRHGLNGPMARF